MNQYGGRYMEWYCPVCRHVEEVLTIQEYGYTYSWTDEPVICPICGYEMEVN